MPENKTRTVVITAFPYAMQEGTIEVPEGLTSEEMRDYIEEKWNDIQFGDPDLDYCGTEWHID